MENFSQKELKLIQYFGLEDLSKEKSCDPISLYRIMVEKAFLENINNNYSDGLRKCYYAIKKGSPFRKTKEFDDLLDI